MLSLRQYTFTLFLLGAIILGGISGIIFGEKTIIVKPLGDLFLNLMFVVIVPLVFFNITAAITNTPKMQRLGAILINTKLVFISTALVAGLMGYFAILFFNPFVGLDSASFTANFIKDAHAPVISQTTVEIGNTMVKILTVNDFIQLFYKTNLLPLIIFSILLGIATNLTGTVGQPMTQLFNAGSIVTLKMVSLIMYLAPIGLGSYFAYTVGSLGTQIIKGYMNAFVLYLMLTIIYYFVFNSLYAFIAGGKEGVHRFWRHILTPSLTAIATSSSAACIPVNLLASEQMGVPRDIAETVIPLGANIHKDGSVISAIFKIALLFSLFNYDIATTYHAISIIGVALLAAIVVGAIPGGGLTAEIMICAVFGFPPEMVAVIMVISTIVDVPATLLNSTGNTVCAMLVSRFTEGKQWLVQKNEAD